MSPYYVIFVTCDNVTRKIGRCVEDFDNTTYGDFLLFTSILWCVTRDAWQRKWKGVFRGTYMYIFGCIVYFKKYTIRFIYIITLIAQPCIPFIFEIKNEYTFATTFLLSHVTKSCIVHFIHNSLFCCHAVTCHNTIQCHQSFCLFFQWSSVLLAIFKYNTSYWL